MIQNTYMKTKRIFDYETLKGIVTRGFWRPFFHQTDPTGTLIHGLKSFC
jgi:hypothetical protein